MYPRAKAPYLPATQSSVLSPQSCRAVKSLPCHRVTLSPCHLVSLPVLLALLLYLIPRARADLSQVHIDHSVTTNEAFTRCSEAIRAGRTDQAVDLMTRMLDSHAGELVEIQPDLYQPVAAVARG